MSKHNIKKEIIKIRNKAHTLKLKKDKAEHMWIESEKELAGLKIEMKVEEKYMKLKKRYIGKKTTVRKIKLPSFNRMMDVPKTKKNIFLPAFEKNKVMTQKNNKPETLESFAPEPVTPEPVTPEPVTPETEPVTPEPMTYEPVTPDTEPETPLVEEPAPEPETPVVNEPPSEESTNESNFVPLPVESSVQASANTNQATTNTNQATTNTNQATTNTNQATTNTNQATTNTNQVTANTNKNMNQTNRRNNQSVEL